MNNKRITTLFLDMGGVILTNGWGRQSRSKAVTRFNLDAAEMEERHHLTFDTYEEGKITLPEYLNRVVFYRPRTFSAEEFIDFMYAESTALPGAIEFFRQLKQRYLLKVIAVNNEGRELNHYRIQTFRLNELFDAFVSSCFVQRRKPDADIFRMASDISQTAPGHSLYIDDRSMFVEVAQSLGMNGLQYKGLEDAKLALAAFGLEL
ncbi:MAG: HAD hydrolase-like protein [Rhizobacter sp.]|nr:HAD hydrolase-like protein [Ferruginibacter sp.]